MNKKVIVAGHICLDITPVIPDRGAQRIQDLLRPGKLLTVNGVDIHTGGAVANTGLAMKILGADVTLIGKIGSDEFGDIVAGKMSEYGAADGLIKSKTDRTSYSVVIAPPGLDRIFMHDTGANNTFCCDDLPMEKISDAALFHFGYPPIMRRMYEDDGSELTLMMKTVQSEGVATSLDLTAVDPNSEAGKVDWCRILKNCLPYVDIFVPSIEEIMFMLDRDKYEDICQKSAGDDFTSHIDIKRDVIPVAGKCIDMGAKIVMLKCGAKGLYFMTAGESVIKQVSSRLRLDAKKWADKSGFVASYVPERILSATGAGDAAIAAFLTSILRGHGPLECAGYAAASGALAVSEYDALSGLKSFEEMDELMAAGWKQNEI